MINASEIRAGAAGVYKMAPTPATFLTLSWAALRTTDELIVQWEACPARTQLETIGWKKSAIAYRGALVKAREVATALIDHIATGDPDWQAGAQKGSNYAVELDRFFYKPNALSGGWADAANELEKIGCEPPPGPWQQAASNIGEGAEWLLWLLTPWNAAVGEAVQYTASRGGDLQKMGEDAKAATDTYFRKPAEFLAKAASNVAKLVIAGVALYFGWPIISGLFGWAASKTGER